MSDTHPLDTPSQTLHGKLADSLVRLSVALRFHAWQMAGQHGLTPTQMEILSLLSVRGRSLQLKVIAEQTALAAPTISDAVKVLVKKGWVSKARSPDDARALALALTDAGKALVAEIDGWHHFLADALTRLPEHEVTACYQTLLKLIRTLQGQDRIPISRMCPSCRYFVANQYPDAAMPHFCRLVGTAMAVAHLRLDCPEHEQAESATQAITWLNDRNRPAAMRQG
ncbi:DNA-binding MarR family transcriptional regulator [Chitinivorax tropicus]|uniref:DNA-binding MarR family transcriptional regulator n=1 Tax=Chitinivorax tropicus TaxID=714531 RepID=A0A840MPL9_9PROT|nr:MarR family winged helix-turn-helix transcriptional regulator [Chitinivorax tropicus]MBB5019039.1 DNA-binding MarR family transcriptional regulator [Chitinivorax tropicus]